MTKAGGQEIGTVQKAATGLPILYKEARTGKLHSWQIYTQGSEMIEEYGTVDGAKTENRRTCVGKNIGKSNETTPEEQAIFEAKAKWTKKQDKGYSTSKKGAKETVFLPMLAHDYTKTHIKRNKSLEYPVDVQPKLNGVRCIGYWKDGEVQLMSRGGKPFNVQHIKEAVAKTLPKDLIFDGELYVHGLSLQQINRLWKKHREVGDPKCPGGSIQLEYVVFDCFKINETDCPWKKRKKILDKVFKGKTPVPHIRSLDWQEIDSEKELFDYLETFESQGFEGIIIRLLEGKYNLGHRSSDLLKLKNFMDEEFLIVGHEEAKGNDRGTVIWVCKTEAGDTFNVRPTGTREDRAAFLSVAERHYGRLLTVKFQEYSDDLIPVFPVGIALREPEDM